MWLQIKNDVSFVVAMFIWIKNALQKIETDLNVEEGVTKLGFALPR